MPEALPPFDIETEAAFLAAIYRAHLAGDAMATTLAGELSEHDFFQPDNAELFALFAKMIRAGKPIDERTILDSLGHNARQSLQDAARATLQGGFDYSHGSEYATILKRLATQRRAIVACNGLLAAMHGHFDQEHTPQQAIQGAISSLWEISKYGSDRAFVTLKDLVDEAVALKRECPSGNQIKTGIDSLDYYGMFTTGATTIIAARPSMGKSTMIRWLMSLFAQQGIRCGLMAVEESGPKIAGNYLAQFSSIENHRIRAENLDEHEWEAVYAAQQTAGGLPLIVCDNAATAEDVVSAIEVLATQYACQVIAVDHLQKLYLSRRSENRNQEVTRISAMITGTIKRLGVCGILASQLSRPEQKHGCPPPPTMATLRESGALEQDADAICFLHREDYYHKAEPMYEPNHECKVIIEKNRDGRTGYVTLLEELKYQRFAETKGVDPCFT